MTCIRCKSENVTISHVDGYVCLDCNAWFDVDDDGDLVFAYDHLPSEIWPT